MTDHIIHTAAGDVPLVLQGFPTLEYILHAIAVEAKSE